MKVPMLSFQISPTKVFVGCTTSESGQLYLTDTDYNNSHATYRQYTTTLYSLLYLTPEQTDISTGFRNSRENIFKA
jgi:hypothetical protein